MECGSFHTSPDKGFMVDLDTVDTFKPDEFRALPNEILEHSCLRREQVDQVQQVLQIKFRTAAE